MPSVLCLVPLETLVAQPQDRVPARIDTANTVRLTGRVHRQATPRNDQGPVEDTFQLPGITLLLKRSDAQQSDIQQLLSQQQDPSSPNYHKWLTPDQYADRFGVTPADMARISTWLTSQGFAIGHAARARNWISFNGTARQARNAFQTQIHRYNVNGAVHYANASEPAIPAALADVVAGIRGLHDFRPKPRYRKAVYTPDNTTAGGTHHVVPGDLAVIYDVTPLYQAGIDGTGQNIAIVGQSAIHASDIQGFRSRLNLSAPNLQQILVPGSPDPGIQSGDVDESNLDIEWSGGMAPNATVIFVYSTDVYQSLLYAVDQNVAPVVSMSYGMCEQMDLVDLPANQATAQQANAQGITWIGPTGDTGAADCEDPGAAVAQDGLAVDAPASIPEVTAVGGTEFVDQSASFWSAANTANGASAQSYIPEKAWNDTSFGQGLASTGGGASIFFPQPVWQTGSGVPNDGFRHVPDLALSSATAHDASLIYTEGFVEYVGGTSVAVPTLAGMVALLNQYLVSTGSQATSGLGNINPTLYRLAQNTTNVFHDVTSGTNLVPCLDGSPNCTAGSIGYSAGPGYDLASGLGSVDLNNLAHQWTAQAPTSSAIVASIDQNPVFEQQPDSNGNSWVFTLTLNEEAGIPTTLTGFTINGANYTAQIGTLFGGATIPADGSISAKIGLSAVAVPTNVVFVFAGVDANGTPWQTQLSIPFNGPQVPTAVNAATNAASGQQVYAPGMMLTLSGTQLATFSQTAGTNPLPFYLAGFQAQVNGYPAAIFSAAPGQVVVQIPYEIAPGSATVDIQTPYFQDVFYTIQVTSAAPGIFTQPDGSVAPTNSGAVGQPATLFITGEGQVRPSLNDGYAPSTRAASGQLPKPRLPVSLTIGGVTASIQFAGIPGGKVGQTEIDFTIPPGAPLGVQPIVVAVGGVLSPPAYFTVTQ